MAEKAAKAEKKSRVMMPEQEPYVRARNFKEVPLGYTPEMALEEASRCLQCKKPGCVEGCPVGVDIPGFIKLIQEKEFTKSIRNLWSKNSLPAICGRVCPQEIQCEGRCIVGKRDKPVAIGNLERFAADYEREHGTGALPPKAEATGKRVAVVGSGPSGLTVAGDLIAKGDVDDLKEAMAHGEYQGMCTFDQCLFELFKEHLDKFSARPGERLSEPIPQKGHRGTRYYAGDDWPEK